MKKLLASQGNDAAQAMAIGDNENDIEMLKAVGMPVIMNSSNPVIYDLASRRTPTVTAILRELTEE